MVENQTVVENVQQNYQCGQICAYLVLGKDLFNEMNRNRFTCADNFAEALCTRCSAFIEGLVTISRNASLPQEIVDDFCSLINEFQHMKHMYEERFNGFGREDLQYMCPIDMQRNCGKGRPKFVIPRAQLVGLRSLNFTWKAISEMLGVSEKTILRRRYEFSLPIGEENYSSITDERLDEEVSSILNSSPNSGERMVIGALTAKNIEVKRERVRASIFRVDPVSRMLRRHTSIRRRVYSVPTPNALWHLDGNHKLIRWRMVVHGGVDGFSRAVVFLRCSNNNEATTVLEQFLLGTRKFYFPRRIRTDHGTENTEAARYMLWKYNIESNPVITGRSIHNQRIERLWRDVFTYVLQYYYNLFYFLESNGELDLDNEVHMFSLQYVFMPRVNRALDYFTTQWNHHPIRTEGNKSPLQLWTAGFYQFAESDYRAVRDVLDLETINFNEYGIDDNGPTPILRTNNHVVIPRSLVELSEHEEAFLNHHIEPLSDDENFGISLYRRTVNLVEEFQQDID